MVFLKDFFKKVNFEKKNLQTPKKSMQNYPVGKELMNGTNIVSHDTDYYYFPAGLGKGIDSPRFTGESYLMYSQKEISNR